MVFGIAVALVALIVWAVSGLFGGDGDQSPTRTTTTPRASAGPTPTASDGPVTVQLQNATTACDPESIRITPGVQPGQSAAGPVLVQLAISTSSDKPCTFEPEDADLLVVISEGGTAVYDSTVCKVPFITDHVPLTPQWSTLVDAHWSGRGSGPNCSPKMGFASPGNYVLKIATLGGEPGRVTFVLKPKPKPSPTSSPSASAKPDGEPTVTPSSH